MIGIYEGPLRHEPLAIELHNTAYAAGGEAIDGIESPARLAAWLEGIAPRLPVEAQHADAARHGEFLALRAAARDALHAAVEREAVPAEALAVINEAAARAPVSPRLGESGEGTLEPSFRYHNTDATDVALAVLAASVIEVLSEPAREALRACEAPGCVLLFFRDHPRRTWCSAACGNRARQARHYERIRRSRRRGR